MTLLLITIIVFVAIVLLLMEVLVFPGTGIVGIIGLFLLLFGIYLAYSYSTFTGNVVTAISAVTTFGSFYIAFKTKVWNKAMLTSELDGKSNLRSDELGLQVGEKGITTSRLNPMGKAKFGKIQVEVKSQSSFINQHEEIEIIKIEQNSIIVKPSIKTP